MAFGTRSGKKLRVAFDVDGTLIREDDEYARGFPHERRDVIALLEWFIEHDHEVFVWSGGGIDYAARAATRLKLDGYPIRVIEKSKESARKWAIDVTVDDQDISLGVLNIQV